MKDFKPAGISFSSLIAKQLDNSAHYSNIVPQAGLPTQLITSDIQELLDNFFAEEFVPFLNSNGYVLMSNASNRSRHSEKRGSYLKINALSAVLEHGMIGGPTGTSADGPVYVISDGFLQRNCFIRMDYDIFDPSKDEFVPYSSKGSSVDTRELEVHIIGGSNTIHITELKVKVTELESEIVQHQTIIDNLKTQKDSYSWVMDYMTKNKIQKENFSKLKTLMILDIMKNSATDSTIDPTTQISELLEIELDGGNDDEDIVLMPKKKSLKF